MYEFDEEDRDRLNRSGLKKHGPKGERRPKKRADGEGTVFAVERTRKDGSPSVYYWAARTVELGPKRQKVTAQGRTEREAIDRRDLKILRLRVAYGIEPPESLPADPRLAYLTVGDCLIEWLDERKKERLAANSIHMYDARIRNHLLPAFGAEPIKATDLRAAQAVLWCHSPRQGTRPRLHPAGVHLPSERHRPLSAGWQTDHSPDGRPQTPSKNRKTVEDTKASAEPRSSSASI